MEEIKLIKKYYGEAFSHFARDSFPSFLEQEGLLLNLLETHFEHNKELYNDIKNNGLINSFKAYIYGLTDVKEEEVTTNLTPQELMDEAGYNLYECKSESDIQKFKKYFAEGEELCTFSGGRLDRCYVFFAVKKNANEIKRKNFKNPKREDEYGTSVISIQFTRGDKNYLSIKNRYNHIVNNPDATFSNNLENIINGLTNSFVKYYNLNLNYQKDNFEIPGYVCVDNKYYKYNYEINGIYYCPNNLIIDHFEIVDKFKDKSRYILIDYFMIDMKEKRIMLYKALDESFPMIYDHFKKIHITKQNKNKIVELEYDDYSINMLIDENNCMISLEDIKLEKVPNYYLKNNKYLQSISLPNVKEIAHEFLRYNHILSNVNLPNVITIGSSFLCQNNMLIKLSLPKVKKIESFSLCMNTTLEMLYIPNLEIVDSCFLEYGGNLETFKAPKLSYIGSYCLRNNNSIIELDLPNIKEVGADFLIANKQLREFKAPKLEYIGADFLKNNEDLEVFSAPNVYTIRNNFLEENKMLKKLFCPKLQFLGAHSLLHNKNLKFFFAPRLEVIDMDTLYNNTSLWDVTFAPNVDFGYNTLHKNYLLRLKLQVNKMRKQKKLVKKLD